MKRLFVILLAVLGLGLGLCAGVLGVAHWRIRHVRPAVPTEAEIAALLGGDDPPVRLSYINTASQRMPRSAVLEPSADPRPQAAYVMSHPSFVLEWSDGRILLVDVGMNRDEALSFGRPLESFGAAPIEPLGSTAERLGEACGRLKGVVFTHLHADHVGGIVDLCKCASPKLAVYMNPTQATVTNHTTSGPYQLLKQSACVETRELAGAPLSSIPGFPGVTVAHAGGHTPGSQVLIARVHGADGDRRYVFGGDLANNIDGVEHDIPKPFLYSLLLVPEDRDQLSAWRHLLRQLGQTSYTLLLAHDQLAIEESHIPKY